MLKSIRAPREPTPPAGTCFRVCGGQGFFAWVPWSKALISPACLLLVVVGCRMTPVNRLADSRPAAVEPSDGTLVEVGKPADERTEAHAHYAAGVIYEMQEQPDAALKEYQQAALKDPDNEPLVLDVSRRFLQNKQPEKAIELLTRAASRPNASGAIFARLGFVYSQLGKPEQATAANRTAIKRDPESLTGYQNLFLNYLQNKQPQEALKTLDQAAQQSNANAEFLVSLAELYEHFGMQVPAQRKEAGSKALTVLKRAENLHPINPALRLKMAEDFNLAGDPEKAAELYLELLKKIPDVPGLRERVRARLADIYLRQSDRKGAEEQLEALIRDDPTNPEAYYSLASLALEQKKLDKASDYLEKAIVLKPDFAPPYYDLARVQLGLKKTSEAIATLQNAREKFQQNFLGEYLSGMAFSQDKSYTNAIEHFTAAEVIAKATEPKWLDADFYFQLGAAFERKGDVDQATKNFQQSLQLSPDFAEALNYLGYMWAEHGTNLARARELIEKALKIEPKNAAYLDSLGWVLFKLNDAKGALENVLKAVELSDQPDATLYEHLGDIYAALRDPAKARDAWEKSLAVEPNDEVRKKVERSKP